jgi:exonuclease III
LNPLPSLMDQMVRWGVDFMGVQETKLKGTGTPIKDKEVTLFYSGGSVTSKERMHAGVGILVRNKWVSGIEEVFYVSDRIMWLIGCFDGEFIAVVVVYAPTNMYKLEDKIRFYDELDDVYSSIPGKYKIKAFLGDWNARVGEFIVGAWSNVRGRFMGGQINENGTLLMEFCVRHNLFVSSTNFEKESYGTWTCKLNREEIPLDYCLIPLDCKYMLVDAGVERLAECWSDHFLVTMDIEFSTVVIKNIFKQKIKKLDYTALRMVPELRIAVGKRVDEGIRQIQSTDRC